SVTTANSSFPGQWDKAFVGNGQGYENFIPAVGGIQWPAGRLSSFFGRANYNVKETYMASLLYVRTAHQILQEATVGDISLLLLRAGFFQMNPSSRTIVPLISLN